MLFQPRSIFISHSSSNHDLVDILIPALRREGLKPFVDHDLHEGIQIGEKWQEVLSQDLKHTQSVLLLITPEWLDSTWCQAEYRMALLLKKHIVPVVVGDTVHDEVEPQRQKIFLPPGGESISPEISKAIALTVPTKIAPVIFFAFALTMLAGLSLMGVEKLNMGSWELVKFRGGSFIDLTRDRSNPNRLYSASANLFGKAGVYESLDFGLSWNELDIPVLKGKANQVYSSSDEIFIASAGGALHYDRNRKNWQSLLLGGLSSDYLFIEPIPDRNHDLVWGTLKRGGMSFSTGTTSTINKPGESKLVFTETQGGFGIRRNDGNKRYAKFQANDVAFHPMHNRIAVLVAPNKNRLVITRDYFDTYEFVESFRPTRPLRVLIPQEGGSILVGGSDGLWRTSVKSWESSDFRFEHLIDRHATTASLAEGINHIFYGADDGLYWCRKGQTTFKRFPVKTPVTHINDVVQLENGDILIATGGGGIFRMSLVLDKWKQVATAGTMSVFYSWSCPEFSLVGAGASLFQSVDGGYTFDFLQGLPGNVLTMKRIETENKGNKRRPIHQSRSRSSRGSAAYEESLLLAGIGKWLYRKRSGERSWEKVELGVEGAIGRITQSVSQSGQLAIVTQGKLFFSLDYGEKWFQVATASPYWFQNIFSNPDGGFFLSVWQNDKSYLLQCSDDGTNLRVISELGKGEVISAVAAINQDELLFCDLDGNVLAYSRHSKTFKARGKLPIEGGRWIDFEVDKNGEVYASCMESLVFSSSDDGMTWHKLSFAPMLENAKARAHGVRLDTKGEPEFFTDLGLIRKRRSVALDIGSHSFAWNVNTIFNRLRAIVAPLAKW